ncbi:uncharacterized protein LOC111678211 [Lucilia cuprina]|uniref:uncharacterized protein LOC111678211 n=1 Tax=Lucilia cuprina TaxID=7375 RepID=UPI001F06E06A|nr:uncharacterized protein LOC111678211 [Lucilia cuprina]
MRKPCISLIWISLLISAHLCRSVPVQKNSNLRAQINPYYLKAMAAYKKLEPKLPREELRAITTIGILNGAKQAEQQMEKNLIDVVKDLLLNTNISDKNVVLPKIEKIEDQLNRDQKALDILTKSLDMATKSKDAKTFKQEMLDILKTLKDPTLADDVLGSGESDVGKRVAQLRKQILKQVNLMKNIVDDKIDFTLEYLIEHAEDNGPLAKASNRVLKKRQTEKEEPARIRQIKSLLTEDDFRNNLVEEHKSDNEDDSLEDDNLLLEAAANNVIERNTSKSSQQQATITVMVNTTNAVNGNDMKPAKQEDGSPEFLDNDDQPPPTGGGGLVGIITSLSGGEGGSDIGALIGALTGVISQIFGPGGLDIETLISSATALISGLLAGDKNFGTVLGIYVGTAFDGLSGGGGAINNGQFIGNFLGTVVASLSADPEEDDEPPKPFIFLQNLISSFVEAKNRPLTEEESSSERKDKTPTYNKGGGSDSSAFIKQIVSHVVGSLVSVILNASLGASGGASHASHSLFAGSSAGHNPAPAGLKG